MRRPKRAQQLTRSGDSRLTPLGLRSEAIPPAPLAPLASAMLLSALHAANFLYPSPLPLHLTSLAPFAADSCATDLAQASSCHRYHGALQDQQDHYPARH